MTLWPSSDIQKSTRVIHHPTQRAEWTGEETLYEKMDKLNIGVGGSLTVDMNTAAVKASGSFRYITETRVRQSIREGLKNDLNRAYSIQNIHHGIVLKSIQFCYTLQYQSSFSLLFRKQN